MGRYDIDPIGVQGVLSKTEVHLRDLDSTITGLGGVLNSAAQASGSGKVSGALNDWSEVNAPALGEANKSAWNAVQGTGLAVLAYLKGDEQMMRTAQQSAVRGVPYGTPITPASPSRPNEAR